MLHIITDSREEKSYNRRLYQLSLIVMDVATAEEPQYKRRKVEPKSNPERPTTAPLPPSDRDSLHIDAFPPSNGNYNHTTPDVLEVEVQGFDLFPDLDDSFSLADPIATMNGASRQSSADELVPNMGSYAQGLFEHFDSHHHHQEKTLVSGRYDWNG